MPPQLAQRASDYNLLIGQALAKANSIFVEWRLGEEVLTLERFQRDYNTAGSKSDFVVCIKNKIIERHRKGHIADSTRRNHNSALNALAAFCPMACCSAEFFNSAR